MSEIASEKSEMSSVEFTQYALRQRIAPPTVGSVKMRIRHASRQLGWTASRTKDAWYADPRISISADELREVEDHSGLRYGREELRTVEDLIRQADVLLEGPNEDFYRPFNAAMRAFFRAVAGTGTSR